MRFLRVLQVSEWYDTPAESVAPSNVARIHQLLPLEAPWIDPPRHMPAPPPTRPVRRNDKPPEHEKRRLTAEREGSAR